MVARVSGAPHLPAPGAPARVGCMADTRQVRVADDGVRMVPIPGGSSAAVELLRGGTPSSDAPHHSSRGSDAGAAGIYQLPLRGGVWQLCVGRQWPLSAIGSC